MEVEKGAADTAVGRGEDRGDRRGIVDVVDLVPDRDRVKWMFEMRCADTLLVGTGMCKR